MRHRAISLSLAALLALAAPAFAQQSDGNGDPVAERKSLNEEQARQAKAQLEQNAASQAAYEQRMREYRAQLAQTQQPQGGSGAQDYQQQLAQYREQQAAVAAEQARLEREHARAMARWKAEVAACEAGDERHCAGH